MQLQNISISQGRKLKTTLYLLFVAAFFTWLQFLWLANRISIKIGMVNILPSFIYLFIWLCYCQSYFKNNIVKWAGFLSGFYLTLRIPITISRPFEYLNWLIAIIVGLFIFIPIGKYFLTRTRSIVLIITTVIILFNSYTHLWLNSPFTYAFRLVNHLESNYTGKDNNSTWECPYEKPVIVVQCDMRHFIASEKIFTETNYNPSFSVFLRRFFYGYLSSLIGYENNRWFASFCLNVIIWLITCVAIFRSCILLNLKEEIAVASMLTAASAWGFISFVAQPAPYFLAYSLAIILPLATLEIIKMKDNNSIAKTLFFSGLHLSGLIVYDIYPVVITCIFIFLFNRFFRFAIFLPSLQALVSLIWTKLSLAKVLGTLGNPRNSQVISKSLQGWVNAISNNEFVSVLNYLKNGTLSFIIAGFGLGIATLTIFAKMLWLDYEKLSIWDDISLAKDSRNNLLVYCFSISFLMLLAAIFLAPESLYWNPTTGLLPRFSFYYFGAVIISASCVLYNFNQRLIYLLPGLCFIIPLLDVAGIATVPLLFDYGDFRLVWK